MPVSKIESTDSSLNVPDPRTEEEVDKGIDASSAEVKDSPYKSKTDSLLNIIDITVWDADDIIFRIQRVLGTI